MSLESVKLVLSGIFDPKNVTDNLSIIPTRVIRVGERVVPKVPRESSDDRWEYSLSKNDLKNVNLEEALEKILLQFEDKISIFVEIIRLQNLNLNMLCHFRKLEGESMPNISISPKSMIILGRLNIYLDIDIIEY
jgi:hypothetical protein